MSFRMEWVSHGSDAYLGLVDLRFRVLREPLGLEFHPEELAQETAQWHLACYLGTELVGCLVLVPGTHGVIKMRQVAVETHWQGSGFGREMVAEAERKAKAEGFVTMELHARVHVVPFYDRLGYQVEGGEFLEVTIPHLKMSKRLAIL